MSRFVPSRSQPVSLQMVPSEVLEQCIFAWLSLHDLVICSLICRWLRPIASRVLLSRKQVLTGGESNLSTKSILLSLFEQGASIAVLQWFEQHLRYPVFPTLPTKAVAVPATAAAISKAQLTLLLDCISLAAKGMYAASVYFLGLGLGK